MKMRNLLVFVLLLALAALIHGCSSSSSDAPAVNEAHPDGWILTHGAEANQDLASCQSCHGLDFTGSGKAVSCYSCHIDGPPFGVHPSWWNNDPLREHQHFHNAVISDNRLSWTTCATSACHGPTLQGGHGSGETGPSCFNATATCHANTNGEPPAPHAVGGGYVNPANHGADAKDTSNINESMGNYCLNCHGRPTNQFDGGYISDPDILNKPGTDCSACHSAATAHPTNWVRADNSAHYHSTVSDLTIDESCALCHNTLAPGPGPFAGSPSCFSASFTNANGLTNGCHDTGPGGAPHAVPFTDPDLHGPSAKADLIFCQGCHGTVGGQGSNPQFNVPVGNLVNGCEDCHAAGSAHPTGTDRWTFNYDISSTRRTHFASGNVTNACALCHDVSATDAGGNAPACSTCHAAPVVPNFKLTCTVCHGTPPDGTADDSGSPTPVTHGNVANIGLHEVCSICHGASDDGTGGLAAKTADYLLFNVNDPALDQGGDHLDGEIEMNGPSPSVGAGYNETNFGCDIACHGNDLGHQMSDSGLSVAYGNYGTGSAACDTCHGYPPDGTADSTGATPVDHTFGANFLSAHNDCTICHGDMDDGTGSHSPVGDYDVATDHATGSINMNLDTQYNSATLSCDAACHSNVSPFVLPNSSNLPVVLGSYGSGGGGACASCHDTGVGGAPVVVQNTSSHASGYICEDCHTGHGGGTVIVPNNANAGIAYTSAGHLNGISLGGPATTGTTEAEICWSCHSSSGITEWGINSDTNGTLPNYDHGSLNQSNWVGATWDSANFAYKSGTIASTHAADPGALTPGVDAVASIRCSYCHDVHNVGAQRDAGGQPLFRNGYDNGGTAPYLMGAWMGNPYLEDGAPRDTNTYPLNDRFGAVPRGTTGDNELGGYQIDQNNSNPTSGWTLANSAGLCTMCHGSDVDNMNEFDVDETGTAELPSAAWVGTNGHSNAVVGGTGSNAVNIFSDTDRNPSGVTVGRDGAGNPSMAYISASGDRGYGFRSTPGDPDGWNLNPMMNNSSRPYGFNYYDWGATVDAGTTDMAYHTFSCSKCHNPHASRLPRLMITNCLDTNHNTWDTKAGVDMLPPTGTQNADGNSTIGADNGSLPFSSSTAAQNCHRVADPQYGNSTGAGWNNVTPWQEF